MDSAPPIGSKVEACGLVMQAHLNGQVGEVINHQVPQNGGGLVYSVVQFPGQQPMALKPSNIKLCSPTFLVGDTLEAHGLQSNAYLNGLKGKVVSVTQSGGSTVYTAEFPPPHGLVAVKAANVRAPTRFDVTDFTVGSEVIVKDHDATTNGKQGTVVSIHPPDHLKVRLPAPHGDTMLGVKNVMKPLKSSDPKPTSAQTAADFPVGIEAEACGLKHKAEMNGAKGTVIGHRQPRPDEPTQIIVKFQAFGKVALFPTNLRPIAPKPASANPGSPVRSMISQYPVGSRVTVHGLQHNTTLNGQVGVVQAHNEAVGQVHVKFAPELGGTVAVSVNNLALAAPASADSSRLALGSSSPQRVSSTAETDSHLQKLLSEFRPPTLPVIVQEGFLNKKTPAVGRDIDRRWFTLRGRTLIYYEEKGRIPLTSTHKVVQTGDFLLLDGPNMQRKYELKGDTFSQTTQWLTALRNAISDDRQMNRPLGMTCQLLMALESCVRYRIMRDWSQYLPRKYMEVRPQMQDQKIRNMDDEMAVMRLQMQDAKAREGEKVAEVMRVQGELDKRSAEMDGMKQRLADAEERAERAERKADERIKEMEEQVARMRKQHQDTVDNLEREVKASQARAAAYAETTSTIPHTQSFHSAHSPIAPVQSVQVPHSYASAGSPTVQSYPATGAPAFIDTSPASSPPVAFGGLGQFDDNYGSLSGSPAVHEEETSAYVSMEESGQPGVFLLAD